MTARFKSCTAVFLSLAVLAGCTKDDTQLRNWIAEKKSEPPPPVDPIPPITPHEQFIYSASHLRDPFEDVLSRSATADGQDGAQPNGTASAPETNRPPEPLESYPLDALRMVGTLEREDETEELFALIQAPDSTVTRVTVGNYLGQNYGRVTSIADYEIQLTEKIPDGNGGWIDRESSIAIVEPSP